MQSKDMTAGSCYQCSVDVGCFDPAFGGAACETPTGAAANCGGVSGIPASPSETTVCLATLKGFFSSHCAAGMSEVPCLCGATPADVCQLGTATPAGPLYPIYQCDLGTAIGTILANFTSPTLGAGVANGIIQCAQAFGCACAY
jgi:hypothetical protein